MGQSKSKKKTKLPKLENPQLKAFVSHSGQLHRALNSGVLTALAWDLHQDEILSRSTVEAITFEFLNDSTKASKLVSALEKSISTDFKNFKRICKSCKKYIELESTVERMEITCKQLCKMQESYMNEGVQKDSTNKLVITCGVNKWVLLAIFLALVLVGIFFTVRFFSSHLLLPSGQKLMNPHSSPESIPTLHLIDSGTEGCNFSSGKFPLPSPPEPFVGRLNEMQQIISNLSSSTISIVGLFGPPAFGKTSLAIHVGHQLVKKGVPVHYIDINEFRISFDHQPSTSTQEISSVQVYSHSDSFMPNIFKRKRKTLNDAHLIQWAQGIQTHTILILDNCDVVLNQWKEEFQEFVLELIDSSYQQLTILITSQFKITFVDRFSAYRISELQKEESYFLITKLKPRISLNIQVELAELVGNCPLAIKVIVTLLKQPQSLSPDDLIEQLKQNTLDVLSSQEIPKKDTFTAVMDTAFQHLTDELQELAFYLCFFPGSFDENVLKYAPIQKAQAGLVELVGRSLIERYNNPSGTRYKLHKLIKDYFISKLQKIPKQDFPYREKTFKNYFSEYYCILFGHYIESLHETNPEMDRDLLYIEQHNLKYLLSILMPSTHSLSSKQVAIIVLAYKERILDRNYLPNLFMIMGNVVKSDSFIGTVCALLNSSMCTSIFADVVISHLSPSQESTHSNNFPIPLPCLLLKNLGSYLKNQSNLKFSPEAVPINSIQLLLNKTQCFCQLSKEVTHLMIFDRIFFIVIFSIVKTYLIQNGMFRNVKPFVLILANIIIGIAQGFYIFEHDNNYFHQHPISVHEHDTVYIIVTGIMLVLHCSTLYKAATLNFILITFSVIDYVLYLFLKEATLEIVCISLHFIIVLLFIVMIFIYFPFGDYHSLDFVLGICVAFLCDVIQTSVFSLFIYVRDDVIGYFCTWEFAYNSVLFPYLYSLIMVDLPLLVTPLSLLIAVICLILSDV